METTAAVTTLKGVGEKTGKLFAKAGIFTIGDLIRHYPRNYDIFEEPAEISSLRAGNVFAVEGVIRESLQVRRMGHLQIIATKLENETGVLRLTWFNMPFLRSILKKGMRFIFRGRVVMKQNALVMEQPKYYTFAEYSQLQGKMQPIYSLTAGLSNTMVVKCMHQILDKEHVFEEFLPEDIIKRQNLVSYQDAVRGVHFPESRSLMETARKRLVFDEFFQFMLALRKLKETKELLKNSFVMEKEEWAAKLLENLPYSLTNAQLRVVAEIKEDMKKTVSMSRLVQGDVGSGKSIVAILSMVFAAENGYQSAMMAPTEVLARQHLEAIESIAKQANLPIKTALLTGATKAAERRAIYEGLADGSIQIVVGTHALFQEKVVYQKLALVITDEQHRFGVKQREQFSKKGENPHILVMSATPIPRTLAVILYGDLDISVIDELPANRLPIKNCVVDTSYREKAYRFLEKEIRQGRQVYVICAMVDETENMDAENVMEYAEILREKLPKDIAVEYLHGKMKSEEKTAIMERFSENQIQVLVSTTVIEVGINVPNATVMMIENAERFGLAQLHQLRGRVGRGEHQSYCIMVRGNDEEATVKRLEILNKSTDGFYIANEDLKLRGPGDLFGIRQSGELAFQIGDIYQDSLTLQFASEEANRILEEDPEMLLESHKKLKERQEQYGKNLFESVNI